MASGRGSFRGGISFGDHGRGGFRGGSSNGYGSPGNFGSRGRGGPRGGYGGSARGPFPPNSDEDNFVTNFFTPSNGNTASGGTVTYYQDEPAPNLNAAAQQSAAPSISAPAPGSIPSPPSDAPSGMNGLPDLAGQGPQSGLVQRDRALQQREDQLEALIKEAQRVADEVKHERNRAEEERRQAQKMKEETEEHRRLAQNDRVQAEEELRAAQHERVLAQQDRENAQRQLRSAQQGVDLPDEFRNYSFQQGSARKFRAPCDTQSRGSHFNSSYAQPRVGQPRNRRPAYTHDPSDDDAVRDFFDSSTTTQRGDVVYYQSEYSETGGSNTREQGRRND